MKKLSIKKVARKMNNVVGLKIVNDLLDEVFGLKDVFTLNNLERLSYKEETHHHSKEPILSLYKDSRSITYVEEDSLPSGYSLGDFTWWIKSVARPYTGRI